MSNSKKRIPPAKIFRITFTFGKDTYTVTPLDPDPALARKAFRFEKQTAERPTYDVRLTERGVECDCRGFLYRGHCKHCTMLRTARMLD